MGDSRRDIRMIMSATARLRTSFNKLFDESELSIRLGSRSASPSSRRGALRELPLWGLKTAVSMVDLTTLEGKDTPGKSRIALPEGPASAALRPGRASGAASVHPPPLVNTPHVGWLIQRSGCVCRDGVPIRTKSLSASSGGSGENRRVKWSRRDRHGAQSRTLSLRRIQRRPGRNQRRGRRLRRCTAQGHSGGRASSTPTLIFERLLFIAMQVIRPGDFIKTSTGKGFRKRHAR